MKKNLQGVVKCIKLQDLNAFLVKSSFLFSLTLLGNAS